MSKEYYVTRVVHGGSEMLPKHSWWTRHSQAMTRYLKAWKDGNGKDVRKSRDLLMVTAAEWESMVPSAARKCKSGHGFMSEHASLERELVDAAVFSDWIEVERLALEIERNAVGQSLIYGKAHPGFPDEKFVRLAKEHLDLFLGSVKWYLLGDQKAFAGSEEKRRSGTVGLFRLTAEWL